MLRAIVALGLASLTVALVGPSVARNCGDCGSCGKTHATVDKHNGCSPGCGESKATEAKLASQEEPQAPQDKKACDGKDSNCKDRNCEGCPHAAKDGKGCQSACKTDQAFGVKLTSQRLAEALQGEKTCPYSMKCEGCQDAAKNDGSCCGKWFCHGKAYRSPVAYALAKGEPYTQEQASQCPGCSEAFASDGFCTACNVGFVAQRMYKGKECYDQAVTAHQTLVKAAETAQKCESCAVAIVTNGTCDKCQITFKDDKAESVSN